MDSHAKLANLWASQDGAAQTLERVLKNARRLPDRESLALVESSVRDYTDRLRSYLDYKESAVQV